jgi:hypothetical protein
MPRWITYERILTLRRAGAYYWRPSAWAFTLPCAEADAAHTACASCSFCVLLVWFVIRQCARVTWLLSCLGFAVSLALLLGPCAIAYYVTQIIGFVALAVVDSTSLALIRPLIACIDLVAATVTATTRSPFGRHKSPPFRA